MVRYAENDEQNDDSWSGSVRAVQDMVAQTNTRIDQLSSQMELLMKEIRENKNKH